MAFLTRELADALCSTVAIGFIQANAEATNQRKTVIQYSSPSEKAEYELIDGLIARLLPGKNIPAMAISEASDTMPLIIAKTSRISSVQTGKAILDDLWTYLSSLTGKVENASYKPLPGAYIGALSTISSLELVGPSDIEVRKAEYRTFTGDEAKNVAESYKQAVTVTNALRGALQDYSVKPKSIKIVNVEAPALSPDKLAGVIGSFSAQGDVFKSIHGMTRAIVNYSSNGASDAVKVEIAIGKDTSKVSSCLPCALFMVANEIAPTSTHLGRGDNWGIPKTCDTNLMSKWRTYIKTCYDSGQKTILEKCGKDEPIRKYLETISSNNIPADKIPDVFLEALTFEKSFTKRIIETFKLGRPA